MAELARDNHYAPQAYLKGWSEDGSRVHAYRTLVPDARYPEWELRPVRGLAAHRDLYTSVADGSESDTFERWINEFIEDPAAEALDLVRADRRLSREHWKRLALYVAALDIRTPASYVEQQERWNREIPGILEQVMKTIPERLRASQSQPRQESVAPLEQGIPFPIRVTTERDAEKGVALVRAEIISGRQLWLHEMQRQLTTIAIILTRHRWTILRPAPGAEWFTSDHPVLRLNYYEGGRYDFGGGWGNPGSEILLPLSPWHMLYTQIGQTRAGPQTLNADMTRLMQRVLAQRAHRWIIARSPVAEVAQLRPRQVDRQAFEEEARAWRSWHDVQRLEETG